MISAHKMIYNIFGSSIYHKPHFIFKSKYQEFNNRNIGLFSGNDTVMAGYFMGMHRDLRMRKVLQGTISSSEFISIPTNKNSPKQLGTFMTISHRKADMYFSGFFFLVFEFFDFQILILQEWTKFITIREWPSNALRKNLILIIRDCSQTYCHQPIYGTGWMTKVMKKSQYQIIVLCIQTIFFSHIKLVEWKGETYQYWLCYDWFDVMCNSSN